MDKQKAVYSMYGRKHYRGYKTAALKKKVVYHPHTCEHYIVNTTTAFKNLIVYHPHTCERYIINKQLLHLKILLNIILIHMNTVQFYIIPILVNTI